MGELLGYGAIIFAAFIGIAAVTFANSYNITTDVQTCLNKNISPEKCEIFIIKDK